MFHIYEGFHLVETYHKMRHQRKYHPEDSTKRAFKIALVILVTLGLWNMPAEWYGIQNLTVIQQRIIAIFAFATLLPSALLLHPLGTLSHSPFTRGLPSVAFIIVIITADIYGYTSGRLLTVADVVKADTQLIADIASYFLSFIIIAQMVACFDYSQVFLLIDDNSNLWFLIFEYAVYLIPLLLHLITHYRNKEKTFN
jgi:hypothetical protein